MLTPEETEMDFRATFVGVGMSILGMNLYGWQQETLWALEGNGRERTAVALVTCNESGKTSKIATTATIANALLHPGSETITTAGVFRQVKHQLWPNIKSFQGRLQGWEIRETGLTAPNGSTALGFSTDDQEAFEGFHCKVGEGLIIVDEAKSVRPGIFGAIRRCKPKRKLIMSSPGGPRGELYDAFHSKKALYGLTVKATAFDCDHWTDEDIVQTIIEGDPHLDRAQVRVLVKLRDIQGLLAMIKDPVTLSLIFAEFMMSGDNEFYPFNDSMLRYCRENPPAEHSNGHSAFLDFAAGGDENVIAYKTGNRVHPLECWRERDTMKACGQFIIGLRKRGLEPKDVYADGDGLGIPILDRMAELGWRVNRVHNNSAAFQDTKYYNRIAEMYWESAKKVQARQVILPVDDVLESQLTSRQSFPHSDGTLRLESKENMRKEGLHSPDRADAVVGVLCCSNSMVPHNYIPANSATVERLNEFMEDQAHGLPGMNVGI